MYFKTNTSHWIKSVEHTQYISHKLNQVLRALTTRSLSRLSCMVVFIHSVISLLLSLRYWVYQTNNDYWPYIYPCKSYIIKFYHTSYKKVFTPSCLNSARPLACLQSFPSHSITINTKLNLGICIPRDVEVAQPLQ